MMPVALRTDRLVLDQPALSDVDLITEYCNDAAFAGISMTTPWPYERRNAVDFVSRLVPGWWAAGSELTWTLRLDGVLVGVIGYRTKGRDIGFWMGAPFRGRGLMPEAVGAVVDWVFAGDTDEVVWETTVGNVASAAVARKSGFRFTGTTPSAFTARDGSHPPAWQGVLSASDDREPKPGWPEL